MLFFIVFAAILAIFAILVSIAYFGMGMPKAALIIGAVGVLNLLGFTIFTPWGFVDNYQLGYKFNLRTGATTVLTHKGYEFINPIFETVHTVDLRPRQVCINVGYSGTGGTDSPNRRVLNCKLVQFNPEGLGTFLSWHGRADYSGDGFDDLLKIYAYDRPGTTYPFLRVLRELKGEEAVSAVPAQ